MQACTLCFCIKENQVLLGMKKRGFGKGKWNGLGGKLKPNETTKQNAIRETFEEACITIAEKDLQFRGKLLFYFPTKQEWNQTVDIFVAYHWKGQPKETEEMLPKWFSFEQVPYQKMWEDDVYWLPQVLQGKSVSGDVYLTTEGKVIKMSINEHS